MAVPPCADGLCGITTNVDGDGHLEIGLDLAAAGGLQCTGDESGTLGVKVDPGDGCNNLLSLSAAGLMADRPRFQRLAGIGGTRVDFLSDGNPTADATNFDLANDNEDCALLFLVTSTFKFTFGVDNDTEYETDGTFVTEFTWDTGNETLTLPFTTGGPIDGVSTAGSDTKILSLSETRPILIQGGESLNVKAYGDDRSAANATGQGSQNGDDNGLRVFHHVVALQLQYTASGLFTYTP